MYTSGYDGDGFVCSDIDECHYLPCDLDSSSCVNLPGSYKCQYNIGYSAIDAFTCSDINECDLETFNCHIDVTCNKIRGSYPGYEGDGILCKDINGCNLDYSV